MRKVLSMFLVLAMMLSLVTVSTVASTAEQVTTGTLLTDAAQLATAGEYYMTANVEYTGTDAITIADGVVLNGNGYTLKTAVSFAVAEGATVAFDNVTFDVSAALLDTVNVTKLTFTNCEVKGAIADDKQGGQAGGYIRVVAGSDPSEITFENCTNSASVSALESAAGFVGSVSNSNVDSTVTFKNCTNTGDVTAPGQDVAGFISDVRTNGPTIIFENCVNEGDISTTGKKNAGGFIGAMWGGAKDVTVKMSGCVNTGTIATYAEFAGGLVANIEAGIFEFKNCMNSGEVYHTKAFGYNVGGFVGANYGNNKEITFQNCQNTGYVHAACIVGGFIGNASIADPEVTTFTNCTNSGTVIADNAGNPGNRVGSFIGTGTKASLTNCINTGEISVDSMGRAAGDWAGANSAEVTLANCANTADDAVATEAPEIYWFQTTEANAGKMKVRFVALLDTLNYEEVGFIVTSKVNDGAVKSYGTDGKLPVDKAYLSLKSGDDVISVEDINKPYIEAGEDPYCEYLSAITFKDVPAEGTVTFTVQTYGIVEGVEDPFYGQEITLVFVDGVFQE